MKKTYIIPEMEVVKIATQQMLASSTTSIEFGDPAGGGSAVSREFDDEFSFDEY